MFKITPSNIKLKQEDNIKNVTFKIKDAYENEPEGDGDSPYINLVDLEDDIKNMENCDEKIIDDKEVTILYDYPFSQLFECTYQSSKNYFTRLELAILVSNTYQHIYEEEEKTTVAKVLSREERMKRGALMNRNRTDGKYGIWGHDLGDLVLHTLHVSYSNNRYIIFLGIDSYNVIINSI